MTNARLGTLFTFLVLCACDRLPQQWPFRTAPSSVTVKLPPAKGAAPGFAFKDEGKAAADVANRT